MALLCNVCSCAAPEPFTRLGLIIQSLGWSPEARWELRAVMPPASLDWHPVATESLKVQTFLFKFLSNVAS